MNQPLFTCIVPCYRQAHFLPFALRSLQTQTFKKWECIIVDDGSPDETQAIAREWIKEDSRFRYVKKVNGGLSSARNAGLRVAKGSLLHFLDADDYIAPDFFQLAATIMSQEPEAGLAYGRWELVDESGALLSQGAVPDFEGDVFHFMLERCLCPCHALIVRRSLIERVGNFDEALGAAEDWDMWLRVASVNPRFLRIDSSVAMYRQHKFSMSWDYRRMLKGGISVIRKHAKSHGSCPECRRSLAAGELNLSEYIWNICQQAKMEDYWKRGYFFKYLWASLYALTIDRRWAIRGLRRLFHSKRYIAITLFRRVQQMVSEVSDPSRRSV